MNVVATVPNLISVSYTHLDVYKRQLLGRAAIANARLAYADFRQVFGDERFARLRAAGGRVQRPLCCLLYTSRCV